MMALTYWAASASAAPITGMTYTYDLSTQDVDPGGFMGYYVRPHAFADDDIVDSSDRSRITTAGMLTDGNFGSLNKVPFSFPSMVIFANGTYAGFRGEPGIGHAPKPKIDIDLGGTYGLTSLTLYYLVEDPTSIYSPRPVPDDPTQPTLFNALTVYGSTDGIDFTSLGFTNDFNPVFGPDGDVGSGAKEVRTATIDLTGSTASHLSVDVRTPYTYIFLSELVVDGTTAGGLTGDYNGNGAVDAADYARWRDNVGTSNPLANDPIGGTIGQAHYDQWRSRFGNTSGVGSGLASAAIPEPAALVMFGAGCGLLLVMRRFS